MAAETPLSSLAGLLGLFTEVGLAAPSLKRSSQEADFRRIQQGGGQGALAAKQAGNIAASQIAGLATRGQGATRALDFKEAIRGSERIIANAGESAARVAAAEGIAATRALAGLEAQRRENFIRFGAGLGKGLASFGAMLAAARNQNRPGEAESRAALQGQPEFDEDPTGLKSLESGTLTPTPRTAAFETEETARGLTAETQKAQSAEIADVPEPPQTQLDEVTQLQGPQGSQQPGQAPRTPAISGQTELRDPLQGLLFDPQEVDQQGQSQGGINQLEFDPMGLRMLLLPQLAGIIGK